MCRFAGQTAGKPTEGFEPSTPALRERCSGQLSYVGVPHESSRGAEAARVGHQAAAKPARPGYTNPGAVQS